MGDFMDYVYGLLHGHLVTYIYHTDGCFVWPNKVFCTNNINGTFQQQFVPKGGALRVSLCGSSKEQ
jgi:hypothetical protein